MSDLLRNTGVALTASIPYAGGIIAKMLDERIPSDVSNEYVRILDEIEKKIEEFKAEIDYGVFNSPEFASFFQKVFYEIVGNQVNDMREIYKNMLINAIVERKEWQKKEFFLYITTRLSIDEVKYLILSYRNEDIKSIRKANRQNKSKFDYIASMGAELFRFRLLKDEGLSKLGIEYCNFIFSPFCPRKLLII